jgi:two-component system, sensor histidine kinase RegB
MKLLTHALPKPVPSSEVFGAHWLVRLRWVMIPLEVLGLLGGLALVGARSGQFVVGIAAFLQLAGNVWLWSRVRGPRSGGNAQGAFAVLMLDVLALTAALHVAGGPMHPFSVFFLVYVALAALLLGRKQVIATTLTTALGFGSLFVQEQDELMRAMHQGDAFLWHLRGMFVSYAVAAGFIAYFVAQVVSALRQREADVAVFAQAHARSSTLATLHALSAQAAHELATPLGTIALVAAELERSASQGSVLDDARLLQVEAARCRAILDQMMESAQLSRGEAVEASCAQDVCDEAARMLPERARSQVRFVVRDQTGSVLVPKAMLARSLADLVLNAWEATQRAGSDDPVEVVAQTRDGAVAFSVSDHGGGIAGGIAARLGEPFVSSKDGGMGLGVFLARSLAEVSGGTLAVESSPAGTVFELRLPAGAT